jgi:hypothetical protein
MKKFAKATLLSSFLVAGVSLANYFMWREMILPSPLFFWLSVLLGTSLVLILALLPAAITLPTILQSVAATVLASFLGTITAVAVVMVRLRGSVVLLGTGGTEILFQLRNLLLPAAFALAVGALWRHWHKLRSRRAAVGA